MLLLVFCVICLKSFCRFSRVSVLLFVSEEKLGLVEVMVELLLKGEKMLIDWK